MYGQEIIIIIHIVCVVKVAYHHNPLFNSFERVLLYGNLHVVILCSSDQVSGPDSAV